MRVLLVDDHAMVRYGVRAILEAHGSEIVGECSGGREAIALARLLRPSIVIMDVSMPDLNGIDATRQIVAESAGVKVIALSMHSDRRYVVAMFDAGASGYLLKESASTELLQAIEAVSQSRTYVSPGIVGMAVETLQGKAPARLASALSDREREVLQLLAEGHTSKEIGGRLCIALATVETHRRQIMAKLGIRTIAELTKFAIREGLTTVDK
jgi:two-component system response regulator NreC